MVLNRLLVSEISTELGSDNWEEDFDQHDDQRIVIEEIMDSVKETKDSKIGWTKVSRRTSRERTPKTDQGQLIRQKSTTSVQMNASPASV